MRKYFHHSNYFLRRVDISFRMGRRKRQNKSNPLPYKNERNYLKTLKHNELFLKYYSNLGLMPESEVQAFYSQLKEPLPVTFRITGYKSQANELLKIIRTQFFASLVGTSASVSSSENNINPSPEIVSAAPLESKAISVQNASNPEMEDCNAASKGIDGKTNDEGSVDGGDNVTLGLIKTAVKAPKCLKWYPDELAWQLDFSRKTVRSEEILSKLHKFLVSETESGNISRQEAVSMIPPLVLDVQSHSKVLDMCAAPGSKTAQLIEYLHKNENTVPEGFVVANDRENKRCYLMVHQVKRLASPCCVIVNHDAAIFPKLRCSVDDEKPEFMLFDRVLADVPCSGDGTMRKNVDIWHKWQPTMGNAMHGLQLKILKRGLELLEVGGRLVYSTCSMHPVEDEAVIAEMLRRCQGSVVLVDISSYLPGFQTVSGLSNWKLMSKSGDWIDDFESLPHKLKQLFTKSMFPPAPEEAKKFSLHLCHRILPHHQDTGGFFVAALEKVSHLPWSREAHAEKEAANKAALSSLPKETGAAVPCSTDKTAEAGPAVAESTDLSADTEVSGACAELKSGDSVAHDNSRKRRGETEEGPQAKKRDLKGYKEDPFLFLKPDDPVWPPIRDFYGLTDEFPTDQLLYRSEQGVKRSLYFVSKAIRQIVRCNENRIRFINMGVKFVSRSSSSVVPDCDFRLTQECIGTLAGLLSRRTVTVTKEDAITIFKEENPFISQMSIATQKALDDMSPGSVVFVYEPTESNAEPACKITFCGWRGKMSVRSFVPRHERSHCLKLFGKDLNQINADVAKMKGEGQLQNPAASATSALEEDPPPENEEEENSPPCEEEKIEGEEEKEKQAMEDKTEEFLEGGKRNEKIEVKA